MKWTPAETPPEMSWKKLWEQPSSLPVLVYESDGTMRVATYELNYNDVPSWYTTDSERWELSTVTHWMPLPNPPLKEETK